MKKLTLFAVVFLLLFAALPLTAAAEEPVTRTGWYRDDAGKWYYYDSIGRARTGWVTGIPGWDGWFYFNEEGVMQTGWQKVGGLWYYLQPSGLMQTGWLFDHNHWYFLRSSGEMHVGWLNDDRVTYYMDESGAMHVGWLFEGGKWYYFDTSGAMATGVRYDLPGYMGQEIVFAQDGSAVNFDPRPGLTGSVVSQGEGTILAGIGGLAVGILGTLLVLKRKKRPASDA